MDEERDEGGLVDAPAELVEMEASPPPITFRPTKWPTRPRIGVYQGDNLIDEINFDEIGIYFPHGQNLHLLTQAYTERARELFEQRNR